MCVYTQHQWIELYKKTGCVFHVLPHPSCVAASMLACISIGVEGPSRKFRFESLGVSVCR